MLNSKGTIDNQKVSINLNKIEDKKRKHMEWFFKSKKKANAIGMKISILKNNF